jgi:serine/threonine protein kinase
MTDNLEAFLRGFQPHRHHGERFQADRHLQTPDRHSLNPFKLHRGRSQHGNAPNATPQTHGIMRNYVHVKSLAKGGMSTAINVVKSRSTGEVFVQKCVPIGEARWQAKRFRAEVAALVRIKKYGGSPHLNKIIDFEVSSPSSDAVLILEYCDMGSLLDYTRAASQSRTPISEAMVWNVLQAGGKALAFLHEGIIGDRQASNWDPIAHLDIKPQNIFLSSEGGRNAYPRVVFADFGCAVKASDIVRGRENPTVQDVGTSEWYPPEGIGQTPFQYYGPMTDIWQLGATAHTVCCFLIKPDRNALACGVPCGRKYSAELNRSVSHLTAFHSTSRPSPRAIVLTADRAFTTAFWRE